MTPSRQLGAAVGVASILVATAMAPVSAGVRPPVTVTPVHGRTYTTFAVKFKSPGEAGRHRVVMMLKGPPKPLHHRCRNEVAENPIFTSREPPPPTNRTVTWRFGPHAQPNIAANGDFSFRTLRHRPGRMRRWCPGLYRGRLATQPWVSYTDEFGRPVSEWGTRHVFTHFAFRVR